MEQVLEIATPEVLRLLFGTFDENVQNIENTCGVRIVSRGGSLHISGEERGVQRALHVFRNMTDLIEKGENIDIQTVRYLLSLEDKESADVVGTLSD